MRMTLSMENPEWRQLKSLPAKSRFSRPFSRNSPWQSKPPDLGEGLACTDGDEEEAVVAVEAAFQNDGVPVRVPFDKLPEALVDDACFHACLSFLRPS